MLISLLFLIMPVGAGGGRGGFYRAHWLPAAGCRLPAAAYFAHRLPAAGCRPIACWLSATASQQTEYTARQPNKSAPHRAATE
jgi:hypothetical protein